MWHKTILLYEVGHHIPLSTITDGASHQCLYDATVNLLILCIQNAFEEVVRLLDLVPVEEVRLGELELGQLVLLHDGDTEDVGGREEPASSGRGLVCDGRTLKRDLDVELLGVCYDS